MIKYSADVNAQGVCLRLDQKVKLIYCLDGQALLIASKKGHQDIVKYLIEHGANVNAQGVYLRLD